MAKRNSRARRNIRRKAQAKERDRGGQSAGQLPELSTLTELPAFDQLVCTPRQVEAFERYCDGATEGLSLGCVVRLDRGYPAVLTEDEVFRAEFSAQLTKSDFSRVAVGDWVAVRVPHGHDMGLIECILPRESDIARWRGGSRGEKQTLAANVNTVIVVQALEEWRMSAGRVARSAVVASDCGARVAVVLTKADEAEPQVVSDACALLRNVLGEEVPLVVVSSTTDDQACPSQAAAAIEAGAMWGIDKVRALVPSGEVAIMLGPSGVGKTTLLNALLGRDALQTGAVRDSDGAGRHTTVARRMVAIPGGGTIVDEPGLRTLQMVGHERGLAMVFPNIADAARECRFRNCTHTHEPGCMVQARFGADEQDPRLQTYLTLANEMRESALTLDPDIVI